MGLAGYYCKFIKNSACIAKLLTTLTHHDANFVWTSTNLVAFKTLKSALCEAPNLHYPDLQNTTQYTQILQLSQEHDDQEHTVVFLSHTFTDTPWEWSTMEQAALGVYCAVTKWNCYLQGSDIIVHNDYKPLQKF